MLQLEFIACETYACVEIHAKMGSEEKKINSNECKCDPLAWIKNLFIRFLRDVHDHISMLFQ